MWRYFIGLPNFTQIGKEILKVRVEIHLVPAVKRVTAACRVTNALSTTLCAELLYRM